MVAVAILLGSYGNSAILKVNVGGNSLGDDIVADSWEYQLSEDVFSYSLPRSSAYSSHASVPYGDLVYSFPAPTGKKVKTTMQFAEIYEGSRILDVFVDGVLVVEGLDVFGEAGANGAVDVSHTLTITDGTIEVRVAAVGGSENPILSGF